MMRMLLLDPTSTLLLVAASLLLWYMYLLSSWRFRRSLPYPLPPGPQWALPVLGHLHLLSKDPRENFRKWRQQYGDIFSLYLGNRLIIVLSSYSLLKEAFVKHGDVFSHRPSTFLMDFLGKKMGVVLSSGEVWKEQRKVSLEILRELGLGKNVLAEKIQEEVADYLLAVEAENGFPFNPVRVTHHSIANIICSIVFGKRYEHGNQQFNQCLAALENCWRDIGGDTAIMNFLPFLRFLPGDVFHFKRLKNNIEILDMLFRSFIAERRSGYDRNSVGDFTGAYLREMEKREDEKTTLNDGNLKQTVADLFSTGMETTATTLCWALVFFLHYPEVQKKCYQQILERVGTARQPTIHDKPHLPYIEATIMEVLRCANIAPFSIQHFVSEDIVFHGYSIPKETVVFPLMESVLLEKSIWSDPEKFRPGRFLNEDGMNVRPEEFIPFSVGRRACLGESLARMELFLFLSAMIQRFHFMPAEDGQLPSLQGILGATVTPEPFRLRAIVRK